MVDRTGAVGQAGSFRVTLAGDGTPGPIEHRIGRRLVRLIDPESDEGARLLAGRNVDLIGPDGERLDCDSIKEAYARLCERLERYLADPDAEDRTDALDAGLDRVRAWSERIGRS